MPAEYNRAVGNHLLALYRLKRYDEVIDVAQKAPAAASPNFWAACAFFQKADVEEAPEARLGWLSRAEEEFRKAIEAAPDDWDTKFDFELTTRLAAELRKQPNTPPKQMMQLLRPPTAGSEAPAADRLARAVPPPGVRAVVADPADPARRLHHPVSLPAAPAPADAGRRRASARSRGAPPGCARRRSRASR